MSELSENTSSRHKITAALLSATSSPSPTGSTTRMAIIEVTKAVLPVEDAACTSAVLVSGIDLTQYMQPPNEDTPFERFLKDENRLEKLVMSSRSCRIHKL